MSYNPKEFWEEKAYEWASVPVDTASEWEHIKEFFNPEWRVLEVGCGTGRWSEYFPNYLGTDISSSLINIAKQIHPNKKFQVWDLRDGFLKGFDLIFGYTVLLHLPKLPPMINSNMLFVEPFRKSGVEYCFNHNYSRHFTFVKKLKNQKVWAKYQS